MQSRAVAESLDLSGASADTNFQSPNLADFSKAVTSDALARRKNDLLLALDLVSLELPACGVLYKVATVALDDLFQKLRDLSLAVRLLGLCLCLLLFAASCKQTRGDDQSQEQFVGVVCREEKVCILFLGLSTRNDNGVTDN